MQRPKSALNMVWSFKKFRIFLLLLLSFFIVLEILSRMFVDTLLKFDTGDEIETVAKLRQIKQLNPDLIFLGSSRVAMSVNTEYLNEKYGLNSYNFAFSAANQWIMRNYLEWLLKERPDLKGATFVFGIDPDSNFDDLDFSSTPASNRIPKYFGLKQAVVSNDIDAETFVSFFEETSTHEIYLFRFRSAWRNMIFSSINDFLGKRVIPTVEVNRIRYYSTDHGYDNGTSRVDHSNLGLQIQNNALDTLAYYNRFHRTSFKMLPGIKHELEKLHELATTHGLKFYIYLPPVWIEKFRTALQMEEFYSVMKKELPTNAGFINLSSIFRNRDSMFVDFQHLRHVGTFETADSIYRQLK